MRTGIGGASSCSFTSASRYGAATSSGTAASNTDKVVLHVAEAREDGIEVLQPDVNESDKDFQAIPAPPGAKTKGVYIEPTMSGIAPFVYSGGGQVFNDPTEPTSLALSEDGSTDALRQTLELLRDPAAAKARIG